MKKQKQSALGRFAVIFTNFMIILLSVAGITFSLVLAKKHAETDYLKMAIADMGMFFCGILYACLQIDIRDYDRQGRILSGISALLFLNIFLSGVLDIVMGKPEAGRIIFAIQTLTTVICVGINFLFWIYQRNSLPRIKAQRFFAVWIYVIVALYLILVMINPFTKILFFVDQAGALQFPGEIIDIIFFAILYFSYLVYVLLQRCSIKKKISVACFAFFPLLFIALSLVWYKFGVIYNVSSLFYIFMLLAAYVVFFGDCIENKALLLEQKVEIAEQEHKQTQLQTALMLSQIRPHFLYNSITAIRYLCKSDPDEAYISLGHFADYLRANMDALGDGRIISFKKELEHIKTYISLEKMRFGDELEFETDIEYSDFSVPALTVQPIVENAVRHGATMNEKGGKVILRCVKTEHGACITVKDNGPGFDVNTPPSDGKNHFGFKNVRNCLKLKNCGDLQVESSKQTGTTVTINIWEDNNEHSAC